MGKQLNIVKFTSDRYLPYVNFWKEQFALIEHPIVLDDLLKSYIENEDGANTISSELEISTSQHISKMVQGKPVGIYVVLMAGVSIALHKYLRQQDPVGIMCPAFKDAPHENAEQLPLLFDLSGKDTIRDVLKHVKEVVSSSFKFQDYPLQLAAPDNLNTQGISNICCYSEDIQNTPSHFSGLNIGFSFDSEIIKIDYSWSEHAFSETFVKGFNAHLRNVLNQFTNVAASIDDLDVLTEIDKNAVSKNFNLSGVDYPETESIVSLFKKASSKFPNQVAVSLGDQTLTYKQLDHKSDALAKKLVSLGIENETIVGVMAERSPSLIVGILAILKAGGAYLPVDPTHPQDRINFTLEDSGTSILITESHLKGLIQLPVNLVLLDDEQSYFESDDLLETVVDPNQLAYVIYTSGSTGKPKGALIEHRNVVRLLFNSKNLFDFNENDKWTLFHSYAFDFSVWEIFGAILNGGEVVIVSKDVAPNPTEFRKLIHDKQVTILNQTPAAFNNLIEAEREQDQHDLKIRNVIFGGEALVPATLKDWKDFYPNTKLINMYGITETTVHVTYKEITQNEIDSNQSNIGLPIPTLDVHILDENLNHQPIGVAGEICVSGLGVSRGYLNRDELTAQKFVDDPFHKSGTTMYRSGDLGMYLPSGDVMYLGRIDRQVKIRGFRIELGEIENNLLKLEGIREVVVTDMTDKEENTFLAAYLISEKQVTPQELRDQLKGDLPDYMIPSFFVYVDEFPLTPNGKIDKKSLPKPKQGWTSENYVAPQTEVEIALTELWKEVLVIEKPGIEDSFFSVGGHSMSAAMLSGKIQAQFGVQFSLRDIYTVPTIVLQAKLIESRKNDDQIIEQIEPVEEKEYYPLSSAQKRMFVIEQFGNISTTYNLPFFFQLPKHVENDKVVGALQKLVDRHESLRTSFHLIDGNPVQKVHQDVILDVKTFSVKPDELVKSQTEFVQPFDLSQAPLIRAEIVEYDSNGSRMLMVDMHHIISDGVSSGIMIDEFTQILAGETLDKLRIQFRDFASWQHRQLDSGAFKEQKEYWLTQFADEPVLNFPTDFARPSTMDFNGGATYFQWTNERMVQLRELAAQHKTTAFNVLLSTFKLLLARYSSQQDIVVGIPDAARHLAGTDALIGMFVNTLPVRSFPESEKTFIDYLGEVEQSVLEAHENQDYPFEDLLDELNVSRDTSRNPLFDVVFNYQRKEGNHLPTVDEDEDRYEATTAKFDLTFSMIHSGDQLHCRVEFRTSLFKKETVRSIINHYEHLVDQILKTPTGVLSKIELATSEEQDAILDLQNKNLSSYDTQATISGVFQKMATQYPDNIAVQCEGKTITYSELDHRSSNLAIELGSSGVKQEDIVAIMLDRGIDSMISIIGVLKAGATYLPIDHNFPEERQTYMLEDSGAKAVITKSSISVPVVADLKITYLDQLDLNVSSYDFSILPKVEPEQVAYIIYTSGTTGNPKGVMVEHRNVIQLLHAEQTDFKFLSTDIWTWFHSYTFDFSVWEMYGALLYGGKLLVVPKPVAQDPNKFLELIGDEKVSVLNQTPTAFNNLSSIAVNHKYDLKKLRYVIFGGEALHPANLKSWHSKFPHVALINMFGITETTVHVTFKQITQTEIDSNQSNIGVPIPTLRTHIMDENLRILPVGVPGELCVSGHGVARGYLNKPEITAERFVAHPYFEGERLYRSGDLARMLPNGEMEYLGRIDHQVKIRGHRIELGEIESTLLKVDGLREVAVIPFKSESGDVSLCAYYTESYSLDTEILREHLQNVLPEYMVPSYYVYLESMPLTVNGKLNRKALPDPRLSVVDEGEEIVLASTEEEHILVEIWSEVLGLEQDKIDIDTSFFNLGGDSIKAIRVIAGIKNALGIKLGIADIFKSNTIRMLAKSLDNTNTSDDKGTSNVKEHLDAIWNEVKEVQSNKPSSELTNVVDAFPMSDIQQGMLYYTLKMPESGIYHDQIVHYLKDDQGIDQDALFEAVKLMTVKHEILRTSFTFDKFSEPIQLIHDQQFVEIGYNVISDQSKEEQEIQIRSFLDNDLKDPFKIEVGQVLWRLELFELSNNHLCAAFICHHAIIDGWSDASLMTELASTYYKIRGNKTELSVLPTLKSSYKDYVIEQLEVKNSEDVKEWWANNLENYQRLELPSNRSNNKDGFIIADFLGKDLKQEIDHLAEKYDTTNRTIYFTAFSLAINTITYQNNFVLGLVENGRPAVEDGDKILGCFLNTVPVSVQIGQLDSYQDVIIRNNELLKDLKSYGRLPLIDIAQSVGISSNITNPLFDVFFNFVDFHVYDEVESDQKEVSEKTISVGGNIRTNTSFNFTINNTGRNASATLECGGQYMSKETGKLFLKVYRNILSQLISSPEVRINTADVIPVEEKTYLFEELNNNNVELAEVNVPQLVDLKLAEFADKVCLKFEDREINGIEVLERSNQVANYLKQKGIGRGDIVAVAMHRSEQMIFTLLGVLKSGAAYVPVDPKYPAERIEYMLSDSHSNLVITDSIDLIPDQFAEKRVFAESDWLDQVSTEPIAYDIELSDKAYIIYTSGSTGKPKGVVIGHSSMSAFVQWANVEFDSVPFDTVFGVTSFSFDLSIFEIFYTLQSGRALRLLKSALEIPDYIEVESKILINTVPSVIGELQELNTNFDNVVAINMAGEPIPLSVKQALDYSEIQVRNLYGPSEDTTYSTFVHYQEYTEVNTIGKPISNTQVYVLDGNQQPVLPGVVGELCLAGKGLAQGYLNRATLTSEKFIPNPFGLGKLYRTGDLTCWLENKDLEYIGRVDDQVKIRGFRIELGEIETRLIEIEDITDAVVLDVESTANDKTLCAFLIGNSSINEEEIKSSLGIVLPDYMVPPLMIQLEDFPRTPNGKIDKKALRGMQTNSLTASEFEAPKTETEIELAELWKLILKRAEIGRNDNFFEIGGHSLKATVMQARVLQNFEVTLTLSELFELRTLKNISERIDTADRTSYEGITKAPQQQYYPPSSAQRRMYILNQFEGVKGTYNLPYISKITGGLDPERMKYSFEQLVERHECLRTRFIMVDGELVTEIIEDFELDFEYYETTEELAREDSKSFVRKFELDQAPLIRVKLAKIGEDEYLFMQDLHHIISDGVSLSVLVEEFFKIYEDQPLPQISLQYKDFSYWQDNYLKQGGFDKERSFWLKEFEGEIPLLNMPTDFPRPSLKSFDGANISFNLDSEVSNSLEALAKKHNTTLYVIILAIYNVTLARFCRQEDVVVGTPLAGRNHPDLLRTVGMFVNMLPLRNYPKSDDSIAAFIDQVKTNTVSAFDHQEFQYDELVELLDVGREVGRNPLFDTTFTWQNYEVGEGEAKESDIKFEAQKATNPISKFDFNLEAFRVSNGIFGTITYSTTLFKSQTFDSFIQCFVEIAHLFIADTNAKLGQLQLLSEKDHNYFVDEVNNNATKFDRSSTLQGFIQHQAAQNPNNTAVSYNGATISYQELNDKANQLAHHLIATYEVQQGDRVALVLDTSLEMIISILGVIKAGAAYVPIDPAYPQARVSYMVSDSDAKVIVTHSEKMFELIEYGKPLFMVDLELDTLEQPTTNVENQISSETAAYMIYTSGSTGKPKGVLVSHKTVARLLVDANYLRILPTDVMLQTANYSFDGSVFNIFGPLLNGGTVALIDKSDLVDIIQLVQVVKREKVSVLFMTTALFNTFVETDLESMKGLRKITFGGEKASYSHVKKAFEFLGPDVMINLYGPTEGGAYATYYAIDNLEDDDKVIPIGKPIDNTRVYILNESLQLQPEGIVGEMYVSGEAVAIGYYNKPELTAQAFVKDPFVEGQVMYKTGDLARWLPGGNIEFFDRADEQVKIRGYRIELGEIENALLEMPSCSQAIVLALQDDDGAKFLSAYLTTDKLLETGDIKKALGSKIPEYMIPAYFTIMGELPLTANGKVDRKALPSPKLDTIQVSEMVAPETETEEIILGYWKEILGMESIGVTDNFFEIGGQSLKATRIIARIAKDLNAEIGMTDVFSNTTVRAMSKLVEERTKDDFTHIKSLEKQEYYDLSHAQRRLWVIDQIQEGGVAYNMPLSFQIKGQFKEHSFIRALKALVRRHETLRTRFVLVDDEPKQKIEDNVELSISQHDFSQESDGAQKARDLFRKDAQTSFDLAAGPLFRVILVKIAEDSYLFHSNMHHIISDGWSLQVMFKEVMQLYYSYAKDLDSPLAEIRIQYKDFAAWQNQLLDEDSSNQHRDYWHQKLGGTLEVLQIPSDRRRPAVRTQNGDQVNVSFDPMISEMLKQASADYGVSLFVVLQACTKILLHKYSGQNDIVVGTSIAGRSHSDLEEQIGFYVNALVLRDIIEGEDSFLDVLDKVKHTTAEAYDHQIYPYDSLVDELNIDRDVSRNPIFDIMITMNDFELEGSSDPNSEIQKQPEGNLSIAPLASGGVTSKFDITFAYSSQADSISLGIVYNTDIYDKERIEYLKDMFNVLIPQLLIGNEVSIKDFQAISMDQVDQLLALSPKVEPTKINDTVVSRFSNLSNEVSSKMAVKDENAALTFKELEERSNQIARFIGTQELGQNNIVALSVDRSVDMISGILGILKSGAAFLPIDSKLPSERINYMLKDSGCKLMLSNIESDQIDIGETQRVLLSDSRIQSLDTGSFETNVSSDDLAYIIYTSGTTGNPKGVMVEHGNLINYIDWFTNEVNIEQDDSTILLHSFGFDGSFTNIFGALLNGNTFHITTQDTMLDAAQLLEYLRTNNVTYAKVTPSYLNSIVDSQYFVQEGFSNSLRFLMIGGEEIRLADVDKIWNRNPELSIMNHYGPTETTIGSVFKNLDKSEFNKYVKNPVIGKAVGSTQLLILDDNLQLVPFGSIGELCIAGAGVTRGYLGREELTNQQFVDSEYTNEKLYKTGDLASWDFNGEIQFHGRKDEQVKIRGYRVELGEIKAVLESHETVSSAVLTVFDQDKLVAYLVGDKIDVSELKAHSNELLAEYMRPAFYVQVDEIPLTTNGKTNYKALPNPVNITIEDDQSTPTTELEHELARIWSSVLGVEKIGINSSFFELGGHSLSAAKMTAIVHRDLNKKLKLQEVFRQPTIKQLALVLDENQTDEYSGITRIEDKEYYELSAAQNRLFVLDKFNPDSTQYNMPMLLRLEGTVDITKLQEAFRALIARHESLRTSFFLKEGNPVQQVHSSIEFSLDVLEVAPEEVTNTFEEFVRPFNLGHDSLIRALLIRISGEEQFAIALDLHHIITDGISNQMLRRDFMHLYAGNNLAPLRLQYKDFAAWQNKWLDSEKNESYEQFWLKRFEDHIPLLNLPTDYPRPRVQQFEGDSYVGTLNKEQTHKLRNLAIHLDTTSFNVMLAAYYILLSKYSGQSDLVVGIPVSGRSHADLEDIVGMFVNTLAIRNQPDSDKNLVDFIMEVSQGMIESIDHQDFPFERLVDILNVTRDASRNPLFDVVFSHQVRRTKEINSSSGETNVSASVQASGLKQVKFDFSLGVMELNDNVVLSFNYSSALFTEATVQKMSNHYVRILDTIFDNHELSIGDIQVLNNDEIDQIVELGRSEVYDFDQRTVVEMLEEHVKLNPGQIAVVADDATLSYMQLSGKVDQLAKTLKKEGVVKGDTVALHLPRTSDLIVGILGVLKLGGVFLPMDHKLPEVRKRFMLDDAKVKILVEHTETLFEEDLEITRVNLGLELEEQDSELSSICKVESKDSAYIIYTSGSTGQPKGVLVNHANLINYINWFSKEVNINREDSTILLHSFGFDGSFTNIFGALFNGNTLHITSQDVMLDPGKLLSYMKDHRVTYAKVTPSFLNTIVDSIHFDKNGFSEALRFLMIGGEEIRLSDVERIWSKNPDLRIMNHYGPTETTIGSIFKNLDRETWQEYVKQPVIGRPITNTQLLILDEQDNPVPLGVSGELCIAGAGVASGYLGREDLTERQFIWHEMAQGRLYKTGDLASWDLDGNVHFLGRKDDQIKIRGYRVELGEIKAAIETYKHVSIAVLTFFEGDKLAAYLVGEDLNVNEIKNYIQTVLPEYMRPSFYVVVDEIPLNASGKIDYNKLPNPILETVNEDLSEPVTEFETRLVELWCEVLGVDKVGVNTSFFELGGDSIKAIKLNALLLKENYKLELNLLYQYQTIRQLAPQITSAIADIDQTEAEGIVSLTPIQKRFFSSNKQHNYFNQAVALETSEKFNFQQYQTAIQQILRHHDVLRMGYVHQDDNLVQYYRSVKDFDFDLIQEIDLTTVETENINNEIRTFCDEVHASFDVYNGPLIKILLFRNSVKDYVVFVAHHLVIDTVSWRILLEDFNILMGQLHDDKTLKLQNKTHSYQFWAKSLETYAEDKNLLNEIESWGAIDLVADQRIPFNEIKDPATRTFHKVSFGLDKKFTQSLLRETSSKYQVQINELLLCALGMAVQSTWNEINTPSVMLEGHGRENVTGQIEVSRTVGWFTSIYPVLLSVIPENYVANVSSIKKFLSSIRNKGVGFGVLKYLTNKLGANEYQPQIQFNYLGQVDQKMSKHKKAADSDSNFFQLSGIPVGTAVPVENQGEYLLNVSAIIINEKLSFSVAYCEQELQENVVSDFLSAVKMHLINLIHNAELIDASNLEQQDENQEDTLFALEQIITTPVFKLRAEENNRKGSIFLFPPAIGFSMVYQGFAKHMDGYDVYGVNFLEDDNRMERYVEEIRNIVGDQSMIFAGHSGGGNLAFQTAKTIEAHGMCVTDIIMLDSVREIEMKQLTSEQIQSKLDRFVSEEEGHVSHQLLKTKAERDRVRRVVAKYQEHTSVAVDQGMIAANIHMILSTQDWEEGRKRKESWQEHTLGEFHIQQGQGDHPYMLQGEHLIKNIELVKGILDKI